MWPNTWPSPRVRYIQLEVFCAGGARQGHWLTEEYLAMLGWQCCANELSASAEQILPEIRQEMIGLRVHHTGE
jgi:hypothetical protein